MKLVAIAVLASACSWSDAITRNGAAPDPGGPCLQIVHPRRHVYELYAGDRAIGGNSRESYERAFADHPASLALVRSSARLETIAAIVGVIGVVAGIGLIAASHTGDGVALGLGVEFGSVAAAGTIAFIGDHRWGEAVDLYNDDARAHGCPR